MEPTRQSPKEFILIRAKHVGLTVKNHREVCCMLSNFNYELIGHKNLQLHHFQYAYQERDVYVLIVIKEQDTFRDGL